MTITTTPSFPLEKKTQRSLICSRRLSPTKIEINQKELINFSSNDYLGLSFHPSLIQAATSYLTSYGTSNSSSRLVSGNNLYEPIEKELSSFVEKEECLIFSSGYQANLSLLPILTDRKSLILVDKLSHRSLIEGAKNSKAQMIRFLHKDYVGLEKILFRLTSHQSFSSIWIVSDTLFSMEGDLADLDFLEKLSKTFHAHLYLDDAHGFGLYGKEGRGLAHKIEASIILSTFGKAFGSFGAFVSCNHAIKQQIINTCPGLIYSTALPPSVLGSIHAALCLMPSLDKERKTLQKNASFIRSCLANRGWNIGLTTTHIIPIILEKEEKTEKLSKGLMENGLYLYPMRPPTVPVNSSRLRISLSSAHTQEEIELFLSSLAKMENFL